MRDVTSISTQAPAGTSPVVPSAEPVAAGWFAQVIVRPDQWVLAGATTGPALDGFVTHRRSAARSTVPVSPVTRTFT
jgi:hypothetical protein